MSSTDFGVETISTVVAALLAVPLVLMGVMMPLMVLAHGGHMMGGVGGLGLVMPIVPLTILGVLVYILYTYSGGRPDGRQTADSSLEALRSAYARGDLSDDEFENRRDRLRRHPTVADGEEVSNHE